MSVQKKLERVRPPRVQITYDVQVGDAIQVKELPFVMGVISDLAGHADPDNPRPAFKNRRFVDLTPDNFDDVLADTKPYLNVTVPNTLRGAGGTSGPTLSVEFRPRALDDFSPEGVAKQVAPLRQLLELRKTLADMRGRLQNNSAFDEILRATMGDADALQSLKAQLKRPSGATPDSGE